MSADDTETTTHETPKHNWRRFDAMTEAERHAAALADPDAQPLTEEDLKRIKPTPQVRIIRRALGLSQEEFATRFHIPLGTLRDWEQGRKDPDTAARAYLRVIGHNPGAVTEALRMTPLSRSAAAGVGRRRREDLALRDRRSIHCGAVERRRPTMTPIRELLARRIEKRAHEQ